ncbi:MAG: ABC transporter ATP-binding protein [Thermoanaerobaculia bacterium]
MIRLRGIGRTFEVGGQPVHALAAVDEDVEAGSYLAIMGSSGSGKSTLLNILGCLDRPTAGSYALDGQEVAHLSEAELTQIRRHQIGFIFQTFHLVPRLDAEKNVELPMLFAAVPRTDRRRRATEALAAVGLSHRSDHRPDQLSGGECQRVAIARATVMGPRLLLADEPTGNLDSASGRQVLELLEEMRDGGLTLVVVSHDPAVARRAERVVVLRDGHVIHRTTGDDIASVVELISGA